MRLNLPVDNVEVNFPKGEKIISLTNLDGIITECNDTFVKISGYSREELIGQNHNIIRHPDMPPEAFALLWETVQAGKPFMAIVKNRTKDGHFYWVDAFISPIMYDGKIIAYESVRSEPSREDIRRAEELYRKIREKKRLTPLIRKPKNYTIALTLSVILSFCFADPLISPCINAVGALISYFLFKKHYKDKILSIKSLTTEVYEHPVGLLTYTDNNDESDILRLSIKGNQAYIRTIIKRIDDLIYQANLGADKSNDLSERTLGEINAQNEQTKIVSETVEHLVEMFSELANNVQQTAQFAEKASRKAHESDRLSAQSREALENIHSSSEHMLTSVQTLAEKTDDIRKILDHIKQIASRTNLLALNASIEAARAGESGRGFAVVADEVRSLAIHSNEYTMKIDEVIESLVELANEAVNIAKQGQNSADLGMSQVNNSVEVFQSLCRNLDRISNMTNTMAQSIEDHKLKTQDINNEVAAISLHANACAENSENSTRSISNVKFISNRVRNMIKRFQRDYIK